jgi:hypothetical protein
MQYVMLSVCNTGTDKFQGTSSTSSATLTVNLTVNVSLCTLNMHPTTLVGTGKHHAQCAQPADTSLRSPGPYSPCRCVALLA